MALPGGESSPHEDVGSGLGGISVVIPVRDDRAGLREVLDALAAQTRLPDEVIVVDGGSSDGTAAEAHTWAASPLRVLVRQGATIGAARNAGIAAAANGWIACTDAGCRPVPGWLEAIDGARGDADFVAGVVVVDGGTAFERIAAVTHYPSADELGRPPALVRVAHALFGRRYERGRAGGGYMAFDRAAWRSVGGFPEHLRTSEDRAFSGAILSRGVRVVRLPEAAVAWRPPPGWVSTARQFFRYSRGNVRSAGPRRHAVRAAAWGLGAVLAARGGRRGRVAVIGAALAYSALPAWRAGRAGIAVREWWRIAPAIAVKDLSQIAGAAVGLADHARDPSPSGTPLSL